MVWGCGRIAQMVHLKQLSQNEHVEIVGLADASQERLKEAGEIAPNASKFEDYEQSLAMEADGVVICLPPALHAPAALAALNAGYNVYVEKPLATDAEAGKQVVKAWQQSGKIGMMGFNFRFHPLYNEARSRLGELGALRSVQSSFSSMGRTLPNWKKSRTSGGGVLLDLASHHIDLARYLFDTEVETISAMTTTHEAEGDNAVVMLKLANGILMQSLLSMNTVQQHQWTIYGREATLNIDLARPLRIEKQEASWDRARLKRTLKNLQALTPREVLLHPGYEPSFGLALGAFVDSLRTGRLTENAPTIEDGYRSLQAILAAEAAAAEGTVVTVENGA